MQTTPPSSRCMSMAWPVCSILAQISARCSFGDPGPQRGRRGHVRKIASLRSRAAPLGAALREELSLERYSRCARSAGSLGTTRRRGRHFQLSRVVYRIKTVRRQAPSLSAFFFSISTSDAAFVAGLRHHRNPTRLVAVAYLVARADRCSES